MKEIERYQGNYGELMLDMEQIHSTFQVRFSKKIRRAKFDGRMRDLIRSIEGNRHFARAG